MALAKMKRKRYNLYKFWWKPYGKYPKTIYIMAKSKKIADKIGERYLNREECDVSWKGPTKLKRMDSGVLLHINDMGDYYEEYDAYVSPVY